MPHAEDLHVHVAGRLSWQCSRVGTVASAVAGGLGNSLDAGMREVS